MAASWKLRYFFPTQHRCKQRNVKPHYSANQSLSLIHKTHYILPTKPTNVVVVIANNNDAQKYSVSQNTEHRIQNVEVLTLNVGCSFLLLQGIFQFNI